MEQNTPSLILFIQLVVYTGAIVIQTRLNYLVELGNKLQILLYWLAVISISQMKTEERKTLR